MFTIIQTKTTPYANFKDGYLLISGKSVPFEHPDCYDTIQDRLLVYMQKPQKEMKIDFNFSAINAVSKRSITRIFCLLEEIRKEGVNMIVNWYYQPDDEDVLELGEFFKTAFKIPLELRKYS
jgi:hypothetical protein